MTVSVPLAGYNYTPLSLPALAIEDAQEITLAAGVEQTVSLAAGVYYLVSEEAKFAIAHGATAVAGSIRIPVYQDSYLPLFLNVAEDLALVSATGGKVLIIPTRSA